MDKKTTTKTIPSSQNTQLKKRMDNKKAKFLEHFGKLGIIGGAAKATGTSRRNVYFWLEKDPKFAEDFEHARSDVLEMLENEAIRRAYHGIDKPVFYKGDECGVIREYSDTLLIVLLKANAPHKYVERHQVSGEGGGAIKHDISIFVTDKRSEENLKRLMSGERNE